MSLDVEDISLQAGMAKTKELFTQSCSLLIYTMYLQGLIEKYCHLWNDIKILKIESSLNMI